MTLQEILLSFVDISVDTFEIFDARKIYKRPINSYRHWRQRSKVSPKTFYNLKKKGYIQEEAEGNLLVTPKGNNIINRYLVDNLKVLVPKEWDELWRVVIFDIPEEKRSTRNKFRRKLKELGFVMVQQSVFCYPYDCVEEVIFVAKYFEVEEYITFMEVSSIITNKNIFDIYFKNK
jgi:phenylacetic acid degradation operon negative regulatory protein